MAKVSVSIPDDVVAAAKDAGLNISRLATLALADELARRDKVAQLDAYLARLETELGPVDPDEAQDAEAWASRFDQANESNGSSGPITTESITTEPINAESRRSA